MRVLQGKAISPGLADGHAVIYATTLSDQKTACQRFDDVDAELTRFQRAVQRGKDDLEALQNRVHSEFGASEAEIFSAHWQMLNDPGLMDDVRLRIRENKVVAEEAIQQSINVFAARLQETDDPYLRQREQDIRDIGQRLIRELRGHTVSRFATLRKGSIIVAVELMPSDLVELDQQHLAGIVTERCGETSHVAILARALGIPMLSGFDHLVAQINNDQRLLLYSDTGELVIEPSFVKLQQFRCQRADYEERTQQTLDDATLPCVTEDGTAISILANLGRPADDELKAVTALDGVGLLRTEFLFLDHTEPPSIDQQHVLYERVAQYGGDQTTIRTLDLGGDKFPLFLERHLELNPNMGSRGLRFSLTLGESLFRDQIRALLLASTRYPINIMLPMVMGIDDLNAARALIQEIADDLKIKQLPPIGVLVETPASVLLIDAIVDHVDFVGIGTNDLTQFILATDRNALDMADDFSTLHPSVLRAVNTVIQAAARKSLPVTLCGEAASTPEVACLFVGMGARRLSMSPSAAPKVKYTLRSRHLADLEHIANIVLSANTKGAVLKALQPLKQ